MTLAEVMPLVVQVLTMVASVGAIIVALRSQVLVMQATVTAMQKTLDGLDDGFADHADRLARLETRMESRWRAGRVEE